MKNVYVLALTGDALAPFTVAGRRVEFVQLSGFYAAIERRAERLLVSESSLRTQHDIVMRLSDRIDAVVPARFGTLIQEREFRDILAARRVVIQEALTLVRGRVQMTVRFREAPASTVVRNPSRDSPVSGTAYLEARRSAQTTMPPAAGIVTTAVADFVIAERSESATARAQAALYHLIDRGTVRQYSEAISRLQSVTVNVSGPWPPFAFAPDLWP